jgi:hypothetical protein
MYECEYEKIKCADVDRKINEFVHICYEGVC